MSVPTEGPMVSVRTLLPFYAAFRAALGNAPEPIEAFFRTADHDERIPLALAFDAVDGILRDLGDDDFGLRAARHAQGGDFDLLEYFATTAPTHRDAFHILGRYFCLLNEATEMELIEREGRPILRIAHCMPMPRYYCDYIVAVFVMTSRRWIPKAIHEEVWFAHGEPEDLRAYSAVFGETPVRFGQPFDGVALAASGLDAPLPGGDPKLHRMLSRYAENELARLAVSHPFTRRVRRLIEEGLEEGLVSADQVADRLNLTRRTLARRLTKEGTGFTILANQVRLDLARQYLALGSLPIEEIARRVGFSEPAAFHRAFKRWSGLTPSRYRRLHRALPSTVVRAPSARSRRSE